MTLKVKLNLSLENFLLDVDCEINTRGITAIYGASGSGKTTLLRCIAGLENKAAGEIIFNQEIWLDDKICRSVESRQIGYVFQHACLFPHLNVLKNLTYGLKRRSVSEVLFRLDDVISLLGVEHLIDKSTQTLSGGERQRVAIARAILRHPKILLMDEPLAALDKNSKQSILPYLEKLHTELKLPILYVSHSEEEIARLADHVMVMKNGKITAQGELLEMLSNFESPLTQIDDCFSLLDCVVSQINAKFHLAQLAFNGHTLQLSSKGLKAGQQVRLRILAKDVSICLTPPNDSSILNILQSEIVGFKADQYGQCLVNVKCGSFHLIARISEFSKEQLGLTIGQTVYLQIKAMALLK